MQQSACLSLGTKETVNVNSLSTASAGQRLWRYCKLMKEKIRPVLELEQALFPFCYVIIVPWSLRQNGSCGDLWCAKAVCSEETTTPGVVEKHCKCRKHEHRNKSQPKRSSSHLPSAISAGGKQPRAIPGDT